MAIVASIQLKCIMGLVAAGLLSSGSISKTKPNNKQLTKLFSLLSISLMQTTQKQNVTHNLTGHQVLPLV